MDGPETVLLAEGLRKRYGRVEALRGMDLGLAAGEVLGFLGPNGAGKTTTIRILLGLVRPSAGRALICGHDAWKEPVAARARVGALVEGPAFWGHLSGRENLRLAARLQADPRGAASRVESLLDRVGLREAASRRVAGYSQGMRQRLGLAAALVGAPRVVVLDEPTNGLDPAGSRELRSAVRRLADEEGVAVLLSSHLLHEVEETCHRVAIIKEGALVAQGAVAQLLGGTGEGFRLEASPAGRAREVLASLGWCRVEGARDGALDLCLDRGRSADLVEALVGGGVRVLELARRRATLEDYFHRVTG